MQTLPIGPSDDFLMQPDKAANGYGARDMGIVPGDGGKSLDGIIASAAAGDLKLLLVIGSGDVFDVVGEEKWTEALAGLDALICLDSNPSALTDKAQLVIPGQVWAEKDGTFTNHVGRVQRIRQAMAPSEGTFSEGEVFQALSALVQGDESGGKEFDARDTLGAIAGSHADYAEISFETIGSLGKERGVATAVGDGEPSPAQA